MYTRQNISGSQQQVNNQLMYPQQNQPGLPQQTNQSLHTHQNTSGPQQQINQTQYSRQHPLHPQHNQSGHMQQFNQPLYTNASTATTAKSATISAKSPRTIVARKVLPKPMKRILDCWFTDHSTHSYLTPEKMEELMHATKLSRQIIVRYFANKRLREGKQYSLLYF